MGKGTIVGGVNQFKNKIDKNENDIVSLNNNKANNLTYGAFIGNIDNVTIDGTNGTLRTNSIVWVMPGASGDLPSGEYFVLETFDSLGGGGFVQRATIFISQERTMFKQRLYINNVWCKWEEYVTESSLNTVIDGTNRIVWNETNKTAGWATLYKVGRIAQLVLNDVDYSTILSHDIILTVPEEFKPISMVRTAFYMPPAASDILSINKDWTCLSGGLTENGNLEIYSTSRGSEARLNAGKCSITYITKS